MKVIVVVDNDAYWDAVYRHGSTFEQIQQEIYDKHLGDNVMMSDDEWDAYDHDWRTDERLIELAKDLSMLKIVELPDNTSNFMTVSRSEKFDEDLFYVVDGKIYWYE